MYSGLTIDVLPMPWTPLTPKKKGAEWSWPMFESRILICSVMNATQVESLSTDSSGILPICFNLGFLRCCSPRILSICDTKFSNDLDHTQILEVTVVYSAIHRGSEA